MAATSEDSLFDKSGEYDAMLNEGLRFTGETKDYYLVGRVRDMAEQLGAGFRPRRVLDFGCGIGDSTAHLAEVYPDAELLGVDTAGDAIAHAERTHGSDRVRFGALDAFDADGAFDLTYVNGVFHHIRPAERTGAAARIHKALGPGGRFALFENNPWNPGTRFVMSRIPFDEDAIPISPPQTRRLLGAAGFRTIAPPRFLFYFPRALAFLRGLEPALARVPLGAQYYFLATKDGGGSG